MGTNQSRGFWTSLTGIITALATFIAAVGGILGLLASNHLWPFPKDKAESTGAITTSTSNQKFGDVQLGQASTTGGVTVTNKRKNPVLVTVTVKDDASGSFDVALETCSTAPLGPDAMCQLELVFSPTKVGLQTARVELALPGGEVAAQVALTGDGKPAGEVSFKPTSVYLSLFSTPTKAAPASTSTPVTVTNTGGGQVKIATVKAGDAHFSASTGCHGKTLAPGGSCQVMVTFASTTNGTFKAKLTVDDNAPGGPHEIALTGYRGPQITIHVPPVVIFPSNPVISP
jgi:hypothetical protein